MGWTFTHRKPGTSNIEWFSQPGQYPPDEYTIHAHGTVRGTFYAAIERLSEPGVVWALVVYTLRRRNDHFNFGEKQVNETMGVEDRAPQAVLDALTPTDNETANHWRDMCRKRIAHREWVKKNVRPGTTFKTQFALPFSDGKRRDTFTYTRENGREVIRGQDGARIRLTHWRDQVVAVV